MSINNPNRLSWAVTEVIRSLSRAYVPCDEDDVGQEVYLAVLPILKARGESYVEESLRSIITQEYRRALRQYLKKAASRRSAPIAVGAGYQNERNGYRQLKGMEDHMIGPEEIGTERAAEILGVSRPYVVKMIDNGELPARKVGRNRRLLLDAVEAYRDKVFKDSQSAISRLTNAAHAEAKANRSHQEGRQ